MRVRHQVSPAYFSTALPPPLPISSASSILIDSHLEGLLRTEGHESSNGACLWTSEKSTDRCQSCMFFVQHPAATTDRCDVDQIISIDMLPDEVLLAIFDFYLDPDLFTKEQIEAWRSLVQVCRRWRSVVFASPCRLDLRLFCRPGTPRDILDVWPAIPFLIWDDDGLRQDSDNFITLLKQSDRVCQIHVIDITSSHVLENLLEAMQKPLPRLTNLTLWSHRTMPDIPDSFLGGSAPHLRYLSLKRIPFPGLLKLLLSATNLICLDLSGTPPSGYISPEAMVTALTTLTKLQFLYLRFQSSQPYPDRASKRPHSPTRSVLPVITKLKFKGISEYLEDFVAQIDAPQLSTLYIRFFNQIKFGAPKLVQFVCRTPKLKELERARVSFVDGVTTVNLSSQTSGYRTLNVGFLFREYSRPLSLGQVFTSSLPPLSTLEDLYIHEYTILRLCSRGSRNLEIIRWPELLHPFAAVKNLYISKRVAQRVAPALVDSRATEILPNLENIFIEGLESSEPVQEGIGQLVAARQVTSHPVAVTCWERDEDTDDGGCDLDD